MDKNMEKEFLESLSVVSHEMKTPLNLIFSTIKLTKAMIEKNILTPEKLDKYLDNITNNCHKMSLMTNNIISFDSYNAVKYENINLPDFANQFCSSIIPYAEIYDFQFEYKLNTDLEYVNIPVETVERILLNLITNAQKYNKKESKHISLEIYDNDNYLYFTVKDNGDGISKENIKKVTEKFFRVSKTGAPGLGLGLSIVKELIEKAEGTFEIKSKINIGTEIKFSVPLNPYELSLKESDYIYKPEKSKFDVEFSTLQTHE